MKYLKFFSTAWTTMITTGKYALTLKLSQFLLDYNLVIQSTAVIYVNGTIGIESLIISNKNGLYASTT